ncbi:organoarsenical effux MFS transporter ArsJ [Hahella sp. KA22]|uniref:organoarsenical effux MFS transporter ArsJ n=1 Tax=Hahella sp. KA22 TaxID=1628392 RepID=UPI000FDD3048|nr:organoarsenical effux MFS transporter ArsJ [Hahella sp. KA22]AZZ91433.1 MFS transporter [Hahella sp. KA22]QAY54802.1 organoarsenical effux MFS transporter ArsJ [Hahella sp. KA22]
MSVIASLSPQVRQYLLITGNYWAFTLTDGALRMLVVLHFHQLGYAPLDIALLFLFYEFFGVVTNLIGGWLGARIGLNRTMNLGLALQVIALAMLTVPSSWLSIPWVMSAQALSGVAKDLNKMSAKSAIKLLVPANAQGKLYKWVALLTGSKNALKGVGFFLGGALLALVGFRGSVAGMAIAIMVIWIASLYWLKQDMGKAKNKPKFKDIFSQSRAVNILSAARLFLFASRDVWFVVALPVFLSEQLGWDFWSVGGFLAAWIIGYGVIQSAAPRLTAGKTPDGASATVWATALAVTPAIIATGLYFQLPPGPTVVAGLLAFGAVFAVNSSLHSYLIVSYAKEDGVSLDVGFYYMANALGRLCGTLLSGWLFQTAGLAACLWTSAGFIATTAVISLWLPRHTDKSRTQKNEQPFYID